MTENFVYRCFGEDDSLLYVGVSKNVKNRLSYHQANAVWYDQMQRHTVDRYRCRQDAENAEMRAIRCEKPLHNVVGRKEEYVSDYFFRLGMTADMKASVEQWRVAQLGKTGSVPSFSDACRQLIEKGLAK